MILLNLETNNKQEELVKNYLQENVSEVLANKINNGVHITKDNKTLISKKTLKGFMTYACEEARKLAENGARYACIEDKTVFGWAIHYFEEDSIEGELFNPDNTPYSPPKSNYKPREIENKPVKKENPQPNLFDFLTEENNITNETTTEEPEDDTPDVDEICKRVDNAVKEQCVVSPVYKKYKEIEDNYPGKIVIYRLGDFYEVFGENAKKLSDVLDLTLTGRDFGLPERVPMIGFPYHVKNQYFSKIISAGFKIALYEGKEEVKITEENNLKINTETGEVLDDKTASLISELRTVLGDVFEVQL